MERGSGSQSFNLQSLNLQFINLQSINLQFFSTQIVADPAGRAGSETRTAV